MSLYQASVPQFSKMLQNLGRWIDKAEAYATQKKFDTSVIVNSRLAPDQYPFARQVQAACDSAKFAAARLSGQTPPSHPDTETTLDELRARIASVVDYLGSLKEVDFADAATREVTVNYMPGKAFYGTDYFNEQANPNFYFHICMAYANLRHLGVDVGKMDFMGHVKMHDAK